jgi:hypothetical protein
VYALKLRSKYGGMKFDRALLDHASLIWLKRFRNKQDLFLDLIHRPSKSLSMAFMKRIQTNRWLEPRQWILAAIDQHVVPQMPKRLLQTLDRRMLIKASGHAPEDEDLDDEALLETIRGMLWEKGGSVSLKKPLQQEATTPASTVFDDLWLRHEEHVRGLASHILHQSVKYTLN